MIRPWPISCVERNFHIEMENSEANCLLGKSAHALRHMSMFRERVVASYFESFLWGLFSRFLLASHRVLPGSKSVFGLS